METYIVRIYRREESDPRMLAGVVEEPGVAENKGFSNLDELWKILSLRRASKHKRARERATDEG